MIYFDNAATSFPKPRSVVNAMSDAIKKCGNSGRSGHIYSMNSAEIAYNCRKKLALLFNTRPECIIFTSGATEALNIAIKGTNRIGGVTAISSMEHNSVIRPLHALRMNRETVIKQFAVDVYNDDTTCENLASVCNSVTNAVITHASNVCGKILPIKRLRNILNDDAIFILDASQTAGHIPIDIVELGVDIICVPAHKGLFGPMGLGALIINPYSDIVIEPLIEGGTGTDSKSPEMPEIYPERLESGTQNIYAIAGLSAALDELDFCSAESELFEYLVKNIRSKVDIITYGAPDRDDFSQYMPVLLFNKKGIDCESLAYELAERGFALRAGYHCAPSAHRTLGCYDTGGVRLSLSKKNNRREIDRFLNALDSI